MAAEGARVEIDGKTVLLCDCGATMTLDGARLAKLYGGGAAPTVHRALCRSQIAAFEAALATGKPVLVGCTQEAPTFAETAAANDAAPALSFVNIRERAAWGEDGAQSLAKIAALLAEAAVPEPPAPAVALHSAGVTLVYGTDERAIEAGRQLAGRLEVTVLLTGSAQVMPPRVATLPIYRGTIRQARGHLGAFDLTIDDHAPANPSARGMLAFEAPRDGIGRSCDLILDLTGAQALFPARREGYLRPDPNDPAAVQRALFDLTDLVGEFDKPRFVAFDATLCAHSRSRKIGCTRCLDQCPTGAIASAGDVVAIDPAICAGCGLCASVCPTGAAGYALPPPATLFERLRVLFARYRQAGGENAILLIHDRAEGDDMIAAIGRFGRGLPARVLPFAVNEAGQIGLDFVLAAFAYGAQKVALLLTGAGKDSARAGLAGIIDLAETVLAGLGYGAGRALPIDDSEPDSVEARLFDLAAARTGPAPAPATFLALGGKRDRLRLALDHLHAQAPNPVDRLALPPGAPFGAIHIDTKGCTLCLACVGACPTGALVDNPDRPEVGFRESACIQCGLCRATCPEKVITLEPRLDFTEAARGVVLLHGEEPFACVRCGKKFGTRSSVEKMVERLTGHWMFAGNPKALDRVRMCADCRVSAQFEDHAPMALGSRPKPRTADDYRDPLGAKDKDKS